MGMGQGDTKRGINKGMVVRIRVLVVEHGDWYGAEHCVVIGGNKTLMYLYVHMQMYICIHTSASSIHLYMHQR